MKNILTISLILVSSIAFGQFGLKVPQSGDVMSFNGRGWEATELSSLTAQWLEFGNHLYVGQGAFIGIGRQQSTYNLDIYHTGSNPFLINLEHETSDAFVRSTAGGQTHYWGTDRTGVFRMKFDGEALTTLSMKEGKLFMNQGETPGELSINHPGQDVGIDGIEFNSFTDGATWTGPGMVTADGSGAYPYDLRGDLIIRPRNAFARMIAFQTNEGVPLNVYRTFVGINKETPDVALDVVGDARITGGLDMESSAITDAADATTQTGLTTLQQVQALIGETGTFTGTTDASGDVTIPHTLGAIPGYYQITVDGTGGRNGSPHTATTTNFKVRVTDSGGAVVSTAVIVYWNAKL